MIKKFLVVVAGLTLLIFAAVVAPASASEDMTTVTWELHGDSTPGDPFIEPQTFVQFGVISNPECGVTYQVDVYRSGHPFGPESVLYGSHQDGGWLDDSRPFAETGEPWKFVTGPECSEEPTPEPTPPTEPPLVCPPGQVPGAPDEDGDYVCQNDNPTPEAPEPSPVPATPSFTG